ncbi:ribose-phosphate diphosphokinase [Candidatus Gracilibacteria bacterium]|nr:ribose-phosphate diphosphokinase [Candidatus Gracilibacteria bacterium]
MSKVFIVPGRNSQNLAARISEVSGYPLAEIKWTDFSDGETKPKYEDNIRGAVLYIVNSTNAPDRNLKDILLLSDAAVRASATEIISVIPYFGGQRQERKDEGRVPITAMLNIQLLEAAGVQKIVAMDLHADAIQAFFKRFDHLYASYLFVPYIENLGLKDLIFASPDTGGGKRVEKYAEYFNVDFAICYKQRAKGPDEIKTMRLLGDVKDKDVIVFDDMIDTAGSVEFCVNLIRDKGARSIRFFATHPVFSGKAYDRMKAMSDVMFVVTDTIPLEKKFLDLPNLDVVSSHVLLADVISRDVKNESISSLFVF